MKYQKIKGDEDKIREQMREGNGEYAAAYKNLLGYFYLVDIRHKTNHVEIIKSIYERAETSAQLQLKYGVSERTLFRYRKSYLTCFENIQSMDEKKLFGAKRETVNEKRRIVVDDD